MESVVTIIFRAVAYTGLRVQALGEVHGAIRAKYSSLGWERSFLRYPLTNETTCPDGVGKFNYTNLCIKSRIKLI
jgi:hypothetical protein